MKSSIAALRKQMAHLAPSLRYVRERRESIDVAEFLDGAEEYYRSRWLDKAIRIDVHASGGLCGSASIGVSSLRF